MRALLAVAALAAVGAGAWFLHRRGAAAGAPADAPVDDWSLSLYPDLSAPDVFGGAFQVVENLVSDWRKRAAPYAPGIVAAAARHGVPGDILLRVGYQESRYREDIISGRKRSSAGATGMFQFLSGTAEEFGVNLSDGQWLDDADGAARYLQQLYRRFGSWQWAVAAYNGGPGNISYFLRNGQWPKRDKAGNIIGTKARPTENVNYVAQIGADVSLA